jgi:hypothetical protein
MPEATDSLFGQFYKRDRGLLWNIGFSTPLGLSGAMVFEGWKGIIFGLLIFFLSLVFSAAFPHPHLKRQHFGTAVALFVVASCAAILVLSESTLVWWQIVTHCVDAGLFAGALGLLVAAISARILDRQHKETIEQAISRVDGKLDHLEAAQSSRMDRILRSHALFTTHSRFESILRWLEDENHRDVKWIIAKVISKKLDNAFTFADKIEIHHQGYSDLSNLFTRLIDEAKDVCVTCVFSPFTWFDHLKGPEVAHEPLPGDILIAIRPAFTDSEYASLLRDGRFEYPSHYIRFLRNTQHATRRRVFLLNDDEWSLLVHRSNAGYFKKFILPCEMSVRTVETRFVKSQELANRTDLTQEDKLVIKAAVSRNLFFTDYNIFNHQAVMTYDLVQKVLTFKLEGVRDYEACLDLIFRLPAQDGKGIYTVGQVAGMLGVTIMSSG